MWICAAGWAGQFGDIASDVEGVAAALDRSVKRGLEPGDVQHEIGISDLPGLLWGEFDVVGFRTGGS